MSASEILRRRVGRMVDAWTGFWFAPLDPLSLGVCRVLVGSMMLYSHLVWGLDLEGFFGPDGWHSAEAMQSFFADDWLPSLWWHVPVEQLRIVHLLCVVPLAMFALGMLTPISSVLALAVTISNSNRAPLANFGMDQILVMLALYLTIGGSGARFSVDAWWRSRAARGTSQRPPIATSRARLATRLIQVHYCIIYFFAGISKLQGDAWWNGEAVWMAFANLEYQAIDMTWLARYGWITQFATHGTVLWELSFPFLVWNRTLRPYVLAIGVAMHAGIGLCLGMITFGLIAIFGYLAFVPPKVLQRVLEGISFRSSGRRRTKEDADHSDARFPADASGVMSASPGSSDDVPNAAGVEFFNSLDEDDLSTGSALHDAEILERGPDDLDGAILSTRPIAVPGDAFEPPIGICDPDWKHRQFAHYLARRGYRPFMSVAPQRLWCHVEQHALAGAVLFVDQFDGSEYALLLNDLTLSPICRLPLVIVSQHGDRLSRALQRNCPRLRGVLLPASCREIRSALQDVLSRPIDPPAHSLDVDADSSAEPASERIPSGSTREDDHTAHSEHAEADDSLSQHFTGRPR